MTEAIFYNAMKGMENLLKIVYTTKFKIKFTLNKKSLLCE